MFIQVLPGILVLCDNRAASQLDPELHENIGKECTRSCCDLDDHLGAIGYSDIIRFVEEAQFKVKSRKGRFVVLATDVDIKSMQNSVFLLGCYLILELGFKSEDAWDRFLPIHPLVEGPRCKHGLHLLDCWHGLEHANKLGWIAAMDPAEHAHYDNPHEGDLHTIVPDRLILLRCPQDLPDGAAYRDERGVRSFSAGFYVEPFDDMAVSVVVALGPPAYDPAPLAAAGIRCVRIDADSKSPLTVAAAAAFSKAMDLAAALGGENRNGARKGSAVVDKTEKYCARTAA